MFESSDTGTISDVLTNMIEAATTWGNLIVTFFGFAGLILAVSGGKRLYDASVRAPHVSDPGSVGGGIIMVACGAFLTIGAIIAASVSFLFTM